jgi:hypothetical protein
LPVATNNNGLALERWVFQHLHRHKKCIEVKMGNIAEWLVHSVKVGVHGFMGSRTKFKRDSKIAGASQLASCELVNFSPAA